MGGAEPVTLGGMSTRRQWFADNEANWNDRADVHVAAGYGIKELLASPTVISDELGQDLHRFGDLNGLDVAHLQCHIGTDTVGFARSGARRVVGLDLSARSLEIASEIAERAGVDIEFVHANVYDARSALTGDFDLVYTSIGVLCWLPDVAEWARVAASLLKPGGKFFVRDDHPMFMAVGEDVSAGLVIDQPYFEAEQPSTWEDEVSYTINAQGHDPDGPRITHTTNHVWNHSLAEVLQALLDAGLVIEKVEEFSSTDWCPWPGLMEQGPDGRFQLRDRPERIALQYAVEARKPA